MFDENVAFPPTTLLKFAVTLLTLSKFAKPPEMVSKTKSISPSIFPKIVSTLTFPNTKAFPRNVGFISKTKLPVPVVPGTFAPVPPYCNGKIPDEMFEALELPPPPPPLVTIPLR